MSKILVRQTKGLAGVSEDLKKVVYGLGLRGIGQEKVHKDNNCIRGMINKVRHLVAYELISE